jgi:diguanylate cyclase (GGDEF)-like protein/PAS domain S-box-containing protein
MATALSDVLRDLPALPLLNQLPEGAYVVDPERTIVHWNEAAEQITGFSAAEVVGRGCPEGFLLHVDEGGCELCRHGCPLVATLADGQQRRAQVFLHHKSGHRVPVGVAVSALRDPGGAVIGAVEIFSDASSVRLLAEQVEQLTRMALLDALTGLPNRRYAIAQLEGLLSEYQRHSLPSGVVLLDIDHFKRVNDEHGHEAGDRVLAMVAATLARGVRPSDVAARWGGEEFVLLLPNADPVGIAQCAERCRALIDRSGLRGHTPDDTEISVTASFGATFVATSDTVETVVARADALMYRSKAAGRNRVTLG